MLTPSAIATRQGPSPIGRPPGLPAHEAVYFESNRDGDRFRNPWGALKLPSPRDMWRWKTGTNPYQAAKRARPTLDVVARPLDAFDASTAALKLLWVGHASVLFEVDGRRVLIDPVFGRAGGVVPRKTPAALTAATLPRIDVVCLSHGHHDHLCRRSLAAIGERFGDAVEFAVPLGLDRTLPTACRRRHTFDWWQSLRIGDGVEVVFVPAQHWHRRGLFDQNRALWGGWVVRGTRAAYHSGDTGWFDGFSAIGRAAGRIDLAALPIGAYEPTWFMKAQHMDPSGSVRAFDALGAGAFFGMHWGAFDLSNEPVDEGPRALAPLIAGRPDQHRFLVGSVGATVTLDGPASAGGDLALQLSHPHQGAPSA